MSRNKSIKHILTDPELLAITVDQIFSYSDGEFDDLTRSEMLVKASRWLRKLSTDNLRLQLVIMSGLMQQMHINEGDWKLIFPRN